MPAVTVSPKFQIVIPLEIRRELGIKPGQKLQMFAYKNQIQIVPVVPAKKMRGFLKGIDTSIPEEPDRL
jgi:AbrB family looped-hinge helix DNA binding protein